MYGCVGAKIQGPGGGAAHVRCAVPDYIAGTAQLWADHAVFGRVCGGAVPPRRRLHLHPAAAVVCGAGRGGHVRGQPGGLPHLAQAGLADAGAVAGFAHGSAVYAGVQRLQAVDRAAGAPSEEV